MSIFGPVIVEAKQIKGQEYEKLSKTRDKDGEIIKDKDIRDNKRGTVSTGKGGVLDSVAQNHIEDIDLEKEKIISESSDIIGEYFDYLNGEFEKAFDRYDNNSSSQLEKRMLEDYTELKKIVGSSSKAYDLITDEWYGVKHLFDENGNANEYELSEKIKLILKLRINYVNKITSLMSKMLTANYNLLGLSEKQASIYIEALNSGTNDSVKAAGEIKKLIKDNGDKFITNNGESIDLRPLGFGVILGPSKGYELGIKGTDGSNKDAMLTLIQSAMRYDVVIIAHGGEDEKEVGIDIDGINNKLRDFQNEQIIPKLREYLHVKLKGIPRLNTFTNRIEDLDKDIFIDTWLPVINDEFKKNNRNKTTSMVSKFIDIVIENDIRNIKNKFLDKVYESVIKSDKIDDSYKKKEKELKEYLALEIEMQVYRNAQYLVLNLNYDSYWSCQPTKTLKGGPFTEVNDLVRQLIKEGYKSIMIKDCNPGGHKLAKDIMSTKGITINHSDFSNFVESYLIDSNDPYILTINEVENSLKEFAESFKIDYNDDEYLEECCNWYLENIEIINEGVFGDKLKEFFRKILAGIIGFFKKIFNLVQKALIKLKQLFQGTKEEPKNINAKFQKPIKTPIIDVDSVKVIEITSDTRADLDKDASDMCLKIANKIKEFNKKQQYSLKKIEKDIDELSQKNEKANKESVESWDYFMLEDFISENDLLKQVEFLLEFEAEGADPEENEGEDFTMDDSSEQPASQEEPQEEPEQDEDYDMGEEGEGESTDDSSNEPETEDDNEPNEEDENYELPDDEEGGEENQPSDEEGGEQDEEFSMDDSEGGEGEGEENTDDSPEEGSDDVPSDDETNSKLKELETVIFDNLNEEEKKLKISELKQLFFTVYKKCSSIASLLSEIRTDEETIQIVEYISNVLIDLKHYINDYIVQIYDSKTYVENLSHLQKYIMIFNAINKVFDEIKRENNK